MTPLAAELRRRLERAVVSAREVAETGAREALESLAVREGKPYEHMTEDQRALRRRLRAHARQLGDRREAGSGTQAIGRLAQECAYEHWHGMLFARFLAENELLIEPEHGVPVTLEECAELAQEGGVDQWALAARFAHRMLPQVFRPDHPAFEVRLAREHRLKLEGLVEGLPAEVFAAADSLGWVYQFWQSGRKDEVNCSEVKIGADELPAVTQLFTEPYMVSFLLDNSLGAWWAARRLTGADLTGAESEAHLRRAAALPGVPLAYLRFVQGEDGAAPVRWRPAAGDFDAWPERLADLKVLDPCCGSGHFLVAALAMLAPMRMAHEGLSAGAAVDAVLRDNLHGLELDQRCVALAAFALALAAWRWPGAGGYRPLPELNLACSGLAPNATKEEWSALAEQAAAAGGMAPARDLFAVDGTLLSAPLRGSLDALHGLFRQAPLLGSLIDPRALQTELFQGDYESVKALFAAAAAQEGVEVEQTERAVAAQGMARAAELLAGRYHLVITNVPYLVRRKQHERLRDFCQRHFDAAKNDLATVFLERCLGLCEEGGNTSLVLPQNWLFLASYGRLRGKLLKDESWLLLARLGSGAFETISGEVVKAILLTVSRGNSASRSNVYGLDVSAQPTSTDKAAQLAAAAAVGVPQHDYLEAPRAVVSTGHPATGMLLSDVAHFGKGSTTGDGPRFLARFWEFPLIEPYHVMWLNSPDKHAWSGRTHVCKVPLDNRDLNAQKGCWICGQRVFGHTGVAVNKMQRLEPFLYAGEVFDDNVCPISPKDAAMIPAVWCYVQSPHYHDDVRSVDQALKVTAGTLTTVPFDLDRWTRVSEEQYPHGLPLPYTDDPTQWIFHGHPCGSVTWDEATKRTAHGPLRSDAGVLQVAVARLLGYRWPAERDEAMELAAEQREWVGRCAALHDFADRDGIVCLPAVRGELTAEQRLLRLLSSAFGEAWSDATLSRLLASAGSRSLGDWLRDRFFEQHCKLFHHRPFVWHVYDGRRDGFHALVNYHKLAAGGGAGRRLLESLTYSYLGDWITRQKDGVERGAAGAEDRLAAAQRLQQRLAAITEGEPPFDIFVRWKPLAEQPIGWEPDVNDGVQLNIRPFMARDLPGGKTGAGILRAKPNIHWRKDRGKEPRTLSDDRELRPQADYPWFWPHGQFTGDRLNDQHLTVAEKHTARSGYTPVPER